MKAQEITDRKSLEAWLEGQPREVAVWIAVRAAARVVPLWWEDFRQRSADDKRDLPALSLWRSLLTSASFAKAEAADLRSKLTDPSDRTAAAAVIVATEAAYAATRAAFAAHAAAHAADAADAAALAAVDAVDAADAAAWGSVEADAMMVEAGWPPAPSPLWPGDNPLQDKWSGLRTHIQTAPDADLWAFWVAWYDSLLTGRPMLSSHAEDHAMLTRIALADEVDWTDPQAANTAINAIWEEWTAPKPVDLAIADFTFDAFHNWMKAVGFEGDLAHIKDPALVEQFTDDLGELRDDFQDIADYSADLTGPGNRPAYLSTAVSKLLKELAFVDSSQHIRARRIVKLGRDLEDFLNDETARAEVGDGLGRQLEEATDLLKGICRTHFAPRLVVVDALDGVEMEGADPDEIIALLEGALARIRASDGTYFAPLRPEDLALLEDIFDELRGVDASIGEARTEKHRERQKAKFANGAAQLAATVGKYAKEASKHGKTAGTLIDEGGTWKKRWQTLEPVVEFLKELFSQLP
jgi:hypothetical protein